MLNGNAHKHDHFKKTLEKVPRVPKMQLQDGGEIMKNGYTYTITAAFIVDHPLTEEEIDALLLQVAPQIEEPVTLQGDDVDYEIKLLSCKMETYLPGERCACGE